MGKAPIKPSIAQEEGPPTEYAQVPPPRYVQHGHDFTLQAVMEMQKTLGELCTKVDRLVVDVDKQSGRLSAVETAIDRVKTAAWVAAAVLTVVSSLFWWIIGDRITNAVRTALATPSITVPLGGIAPNAPSPAQGRQ